MRGVIPRRCKVTWQHENIHMYLGRETSGLDSAHIDFLNPILTVYWTMGETQRGKWGFLKMFTMYLTKFPRTMKKWGCQEWQKHALTGDRESSRVSAMTALRSIGNVVWEPFFFCRFQPQRCGFSRPWPSCWASKQEYLTWWKCPPRCAIFLLLFLLRSISLQFSQVLQSSMVQPKIPCYLPKGLELLPEVESVYLQPDTSSPVTNSRPVSNIQFISHLESCLQLPQAANFELRGNSANFLNKCI